MDKWGIKKIFSLYDRKIEIKYNNKTIFKRRKPKSFKIRKSFFNELWDCDRECYNKNRKGCCVNINDNVVLTGGDFSKNKRSNFENTYTILVNGNEVQIDEIQLIKIPCPYYSNQLCTLGFPQNKEDFYRISPLICATTPGMYIKNRDHQLVLMRKFCTSKRHKKLYNSETWKLDKIVIKRFYDFYVKCGLETDYTFLKLLENTIYRFPKK